MKKILLLLIIFLSYSFSEVIDSSDLPFFKDSEGNCYKQGSLASTEGPDAFDFSDRNYWDFSPGIHRLVNYVVEDSYMTKYYYYYSSIDCSEYPVAIQCSTNQVIYNNECYNVNSVVSDDLCNGFIVSTSEKDDYNNVIGICSSCPDISTDVTAQTSKGWISYVNVYNTELECAKKAQDDYIGRYTFQVYQKDNCIYNICFIDTFNYNGCEDAQNYSDLIESGYIMKGIVNFEESCRSYVDTVNYLNYYVKRVYPDCEYDTSMYCFLKPSLDNPDEGVPPPDENSTNPDGTIKLDSNNSVVPELNTSTFSGYDLNTTSQTNNLLTSLSADIKRFIDIYRADDDYWRNENDKNFKFRTQNDNVNTNKIIEAVNSNKIDTSLIEQKLDTLIGDTTDVSSEVLGDIGSLGDSLTDFNFTGGDTNISSSLTSTDIVDNLEGAYEGFGDKAINSITIMINDIDFGILDIFSVTDRDFQDYVISDIYISSDVKIGGKLMDASFLNSLDWSYAKLALLLATLLASAKYIFERVA